MINEDGGKHDTLKLFLASLWAGGAWLLRFFITRYYSRKDEAQKLKREDKLEKLLESDINSRKKGKAHSNSK